MVYDAESDRVVLFGGFDGTVALGETWAYDLNTNTWSNKAPAVGPIGRRSFAMAYDAQSDLIVLFGGVDQNTVDLGDTWVYDLNTNSWVARSPSPAPAPDHAFKMAYDAESDRIVLSGSGATFSTTWLYDTDSNTWTTVGRAPSAADHALAYDTGSDRTISFGGYDASLVRTNETWTYNVNGDTWTNAEPLASPPPLARLATAHDSQSDRTILFGGDTASGTSNETWAFDLGANLWTKMDPSDYPTGRIGHRMAYDVESDRIVLFGGVSEVGGIRNDETWVYDFDANDWTPMDVVLAPAARLASGMAYDSGSRRTILFGGFTEQRVFLGDTWAYDLGTNTWTNMNPSGAPLERGDPGFAYEAAADRVVLFGGIMKLDGETSYVDLNDTWSYHFETNAWRRLDPATAPSPRHGHKVAYDAESHRLILVGGHTCRYDAIPPTCTLYGDTWAYDYENNTWTNLTPATGPSTPNFHGFAYDAESDLAVLYGGDGSTALETWAYDFNTNAWTKLNPQSSPGSLSFHAMAYDRESDRIVLFGGLKAGGIRSDETWAYDQNTITWTRANPVTRPSGRQDHAMAYDAQSDRVILFGGCRDFERDCNNETWSYDFNSTTWTPLTRPSAPHLVASAGDGRVDLSWSAPSSTGGVPVTKYRIYRGAGSGNLDFLAEIGNVLSYADSTVTNGATYRYAVTARTAAGEGSPSNEVQAVPTPEPDAIKPTVAITSPIEGATLGTVTVTVSGTASDNIGLTKVELSTDNLNWASATGTTSWSGTLALNEGPNTIYARAVDTSGNEATASRDLMVDATNPTVTISSPAEGATLESRTVTVTGTASDNWALEKVQLSTDQATWVPAVGTTDWSGTVTLKEGEKSIYVRATDRAGNAASDRISVTVRPPGLSPLLIGSALGGVVAAAALGFGLLLRRRRRGP